MHTRGAMGGRSIRSRGSATALGTVTAVFLALLTKPWAAVPVRAACPSPTNDVPLDMERPLPVVYPPLVEVVNIYWHNDWDNLPAHANFKKADLDLATSRLLSSDYFARLCQYGALKAPALRYWGGKDTGQNILGIPNNPCSLTSPGATVNSIQIQNFLSCEESLGYRTEVPPQVAAPAPCTSCELAYAQIPGFPANPIGTPPPSCADIVLANIAAKIALGQPPDPSDLGCIANPDTSGEKIYNIILPKGTTIDDKVSQSCTSTSAGAYGAYHMQVPSRILVGGGLPPMYIAQTSGRPLYYTVTILDCASSVEDWMLALSHELLETLTDSLPLSHWIDDSTAHENPSLLDMLMKTPGLLAKGEAADICQDALAPTRLTGSSFVVPGAPPWSLDVAPYWSNADNACVVGSRRVVETTFRASGLPSGVADLSVSVVDPLLIHFDTVSLARSGSNYDATERYLEGHVYTFPADVNTPSGTFHSAGCGGLLPFPAPRDPNNPRPEDQVQTIVCNYGPPVNGACGTANHGTFSSPPTTDLCAAGTPSAVSAAGRWEWSCSGTFGGTGVACSANVTTYTVTFVAGPNGRIQTNGSLTQTVTHGGSTTEVLTRPDYGYHFVNWTDQSGAEVSTADPFALTNVTSNRTITANFAADPIPGECGPASGQTYASCFTGTPTDLCAVGTPSPVTGSGPWVWTCAGPDGGPAANCSARIQLACVPQPRRRASWWPLEEGAGDTIGDRNGTLENYPTFVQGRVGRALSVNGESQYVSLPESTLLGTNAWTVAAWFKTAAAGVIAGAQNGSYGSTLDTGVNAWAPLLFVGTDHKLHGGVWPAQLGGGPLVSDREWHHAAITYENGSVNLYLDGVSIGSAAGVSPQLMPVNQIGTGYTVFWDAGNNGWFDFNGEIDEVLLFDRPLGVGEVRAIHKAGTSGICNSNEDLDPSFNGSGSVVSHLPGGWSAGRAVALQPDGKIVVAGQYDGALVVARYLPCGALDPAFGNGTGIFALGLVGASMGSGVAVQDGKIVVAGRSESLVADWQILLVRLNTDGSLDTSFGGTGYVRWNDGWESTAATLLVQDGKILVTGVTAAEDYTHDLLLMRYNWNGTLDTSFGPAHTGVVTVPAMTYDGSLGGEAVDVQSVDGKALAVQPWDGKILVLAESGFPSHTAVYRFTSGGILDTAFGVAGSTVPYHGGVPGLGGDTYGASGSGVAVQNDRRILAAGMGTSDPEGTRAVVLRYTEAGLIDTTYGSWGEGSFPEIGSGSEIAGLAMQSDGKSILLGTMGDQVHPGNPYGQTDVLLVRFTTQGSVDRTFGTDGVVLFNGPLNASDEGRGMMLDRDGKIVVAGETQRTTDSASRDILVLRVQPRTATLLRTDVGPTDDRIPVDDVSRFPDWGTIQIGDERIRYDKKQKAVVAAAVASEAGYLANVQRGIDGTVASAHGAGDPVVLVGSPACAGDCDADGRVTVDELLTGVDILLGDEPADRCRSLDADLDGLVGIDELIGGVTSTLKGCAR